MQSGHVIDTYRMGSEGNNEHICDFPSLLSRHLKCSWGPLQDSAPARPSGSIPCRFPPHSLHSATASFFLPSDPRSSHRRAFAYAAFRSRMLPSLGEVSLITEVSVCGCGSQARGICQRLEIVWVVTVGGKLLASSEKRPRILLHSR